ncbi:MAG: tRNA 2-thiouridine(34) synthase MnmA [Dissulfurispiraceae bacterium]
MKKIIVGMSGGVDSSVAAYLLKKRGYQVEGLSFILYEARSRKTFAKAPCCSLASVNDASKTAEMIGVPHTTVDLRDEFMQKVIEPFIDAYAIGITPNPCILCNRYIKFPSLLRNADERNADFIATGHYATIERSRQTESISTILKKGKDARKDQSYVLYALSPQEMNRLVLPLGDWEKGNVRKLALQLYIPASKRPESQEICFIEEKNYSSFIENATGEKEGPIIDAETNKVIGNHRGVHLYTIGQRKRLIATGKPLYVVKIDARENAVYVGSREKVLIRQFQVVDVVWHQSAQVVGHEQKDVNLGLKSFDASVKVRSTMNDEPARITVEDRGGGEKIWVTFDKPQWAPAPGQSAVFYEGEIVIGGGVIKSGACDAILSK